MEKKYIGCDAHRRYSVFVAMDDKGHVNLYQRLKAAKGHGKAAVAVARHLAEASWWILTKQQSYREPNRAPIASSAHG